MPTFSPPALDSVRAFAKGTAFHADCMEPMGDMRRASDARVPNWQPAEKNPAPVYVPDAISELCEMCRAQGNDPDADTTASQALWDALQAQLERGEEVRDEMRTALLVAKYVLTRLAPQVQAMCYRAGSAPKLIDQALTADEEDRPSGRTQILGTTTAVLLFLSRPDVAKLMDQNAAQAVEKFAKACKEVA